MHLGNLTSLHGILYFPAEKGQNVNPLRLLGYSLKCVLLWVYSWRPSVTVWHHWTWSTLLQVMVWHHAITWSNADLLSVGVLQTNLEGNHCILIEISLNFVEVQWNFNQNTMISFKQTDGYFSITPSLLTPWPSRVDQDRVLEAVTAWSLLPM